MSSSPQPATGTKGPYLVIRTSRKVWEIPLDREVFTIGREESSDILLAEPGVSRHHARVERRGESFAIIDLQSTNGTWVGLQRIADEHRLLDGDTIFVGGTRLIYKSGDGAPRPNAEPRPTVGSELPVHVATVEIVIDEARRRSQVEEVVNSETYRRILARARELRQAKHHR